MTAPTIGLRPKEFAQALLGSAQNILKRLEEKMQKEPHSPIKDLLLPHSKFLPGESQKGRYPKRNIQRKCYKEEDVTDQDEYLRQQRRPPEGQEISPSNLVHRLLEHQGSGTRGVDGDAPGGGVVFGPYKGKVVKKGGAGVKESGYEWQVRRETKTSLYVEGVDEGSSNWMRYVNCADSEEWQNVA
ncbi:histone-lysine N-methyltransferase PRDM9 [Caerostris extrusa]|uniref:Histone-lysine N-methyltransferase PRDM9 n=1 Tax=Caerostris extrusa TaxID=172846 RepID=A0AAV4NHH8_CAEEX|nr:histone-lysine N-methyltransferase PRDM9 [Caerostris extrusa]